MKRVVGVLCLLIGLGGLVAAGSMAVTSIRFKTTAEKTVGTIAKLERRTHTTTTRRGRTGQTTTTWAPVFEFADTSGATQRVTSSYSTSDTSRKVGDTVPVLYLRGAPQGARIDSFASFWLGPLLCLLGALLFSVLGIVLALKGR